MKLFSYIVSMVISITYLYTHESQPNIDELLERTPYAHLINELICISDSIALLEHPKIDRYDKRFIEDSILGKLVRAHNYLRTLNTKEMTAYDIAYMRSWIELALQSTHESFLLQEMIRFAEHVDELFKKEGHPEMVAHH